MVSASVYVAAAAAQVVPLATHTMCGRELSAEAQASAPVMVWNGTVLFVAAALVSLPVGATFTQLAQCSSTAPSQSSSIESHVVSLAAPAGATHVPPAPPVHEATVVRHAPRPHVIWPSPSSSVPLQSSSSPLHASPDGTI